ncbi:hypothetical protein D3C71_1156100 [compost metagenome]
MLPARRPLGRVDRASHLRFHASASVRRAAPCWVCIAAIRFQTQALSPLRHVRAGTRAQTKTEPRRERGGRCPQASFSDKSSLCWVWPSAACGRQHSGRLMRWAFNRGSELHGSIFPACPFTSPGSSSSGGTSTMPTHPTCSFAAAPSRHRADCSPPARPSAWRSGDHVWPNASRLMGRPAGPMRMRSSRRA